MTGKRLLIFAGFANFGISLLHVAIPFFGVGGYIYFGALDLALLESQGSPIPRLATWFLALVFAAFGFYCLSGAGIVRRLPLVMPVVWLIGGIYTLRGLIFFLDILRFLNGIIYPIRQTVFSASALTIGLCILVGSWLVNKWIDQNSRSMKGRNR